MQNVDKLIEKYKNDMLSMMKRSYFPYEEAEPALGETDETAETVESGEEPAVSVAAQNEPVRREAQNIALDDESRRDPNISHSEGGFGSLKVRVFVGNIAYPIETAFVRILDSNGTVIREGYTNQSGIFDATRLPTPDKSISESPGNEKGYTGYKIIVTHPRFNTEIFENVPVFEGVESIQDVRMEIGNSEEPILTVESEPDDLRRTDNGR